MVDLAEAFMTTTENDQALVLSKSRSTKKNDLVGFSVLSEYSRRSIVVTLSHSLVACGYGCRDHLSESVSSVPNPSL